MLSLQGSLQPDPFSPAHVPRTTMKAISEPPSESSTAVVRDVILPLEEEEEGYDEEDEVDTFERLGRMGDEAVALEMKQRTDEAKEVEAAEEKERERKKKRKRKDGDVKVKSESKGKRSRT
jgi:DNA-directed RNA polymerase I subunit RPA43